MATTHGRRHYTMSAAAIQQRRMARACRAKSAKGRKSQAGQTIGLHIPQQVAAIVMLYRQGKERRAFVSNAIRHHSQLALGNPPLRVI